MNLTWHGQTCFKIVSTKSKDGQVDILIDPLEEGTGLRGPKSEADIIILTEEDRKGISGGFLISGPGEYDIKEVYVRGISSDKSSKNIIYVIEAEEIRICHLGFINQPELTPDQLEKIGDVDILLVPIGGGGAIEAKDAVKIMSQIEPKITIPMHYHVPGLKVKLDGLDKFLKLLGIKSLEALPKLSIKKKDVSEEEAKIIVLQP